MKYEQEKAEKAKQWQEKYDSIEMPRLLDIGLVRFSVVVVLMWVLLVVIIVRDIFQQKGISIHISGK